MSLVRWNPSENFFSLKNELDSIFDDIFRVNWMDRHNPGNWMPSVDIEETNTEYQLSLELPGVRKEDVRITFKDDVLTISGEKKQEVRKDDVNLHRYERSFGKFERNFRLNGQVLPDKIDAHYKDGILSIRLPKAEISKPKEIEVKVK
jgi:HSP20 family protein